MHACDLTPRRHKGILRQKRFVSSRYRFSRKEVCSSSSTYNTRIDLIQNTIKVYAYISVVVFFWKTCLSVERYGKKMLFTLKLFFFMFLLCAFYRIFLYFFFVFGYRRQSRQRRRQNVFFAIFSSFRSVYRSIDFTYLIGIPTQRSDSLFSRHSAPLAQNFEACSVIFVHTSKFKYSSASFNDARSFILARPKLFSTHSPIRVSFLQIIVVIVA